MSSGLAILCNNISSGSKWGRKRAECFGKGILSSGKVCFVFRQKSHSTHLSGLRMISSNRPLRFRRIPCRKCAPQNRRENRKEARLETFKLVKFQTTPLFLQLYCYELPAWTNQKTEPCCETFSAKTQVWEGDFCRNPYTPVSLQNTSLQIRLFSDVMQPEVSQQNSGYLASPPFW